MDISVGSVFIFISFFPPHKTGGVCKCASAIWTLSGVFFFFEEEWQVSQEHGHGPLTAPFVWLRILRLDDQPAEAGKSRTGSVFVETGVQGCITLEGTERVTRVHPVSALVFTPTLRSTHTLPTHQLTYALLFIQAVRYHFGDGSTNYNRRIATTLTKSLKKIFPNWNKRLEKHVFSHLLCI